MAAKHGNKDAFAALVRAYKDYVFRIAYGILMNRMEAEDVAQETFVKAYLQLRGLREERSFPSWLATIATHRALDVAKQQQRWRLVSMEEDLPSGETDEMARVDKRILVQELLGKLNPIHRAVLILREIQGYDYAEISRILGVPIGTVRSRLNIARAHLRKLAVAAGEVGTNGNEKL